MVKEITPSIDGSLGLVYRLNILWNKADWAAEKAEYDKWNAILDSLYRNLLYREDVIVGESKEGEILSVKLNKKDSKVYKYLSKKVSLAKRAYLLEKSPNKKSILRSKWYHSLQMKDIWIRKFMNSLKLYLRETEKTPGSALFGTFGHKK